MALLNPRNLQFLRSKLSLLFQILVYSRKETSGSQWTRRSFRVAGAQDLRSDSWSHVRRRGCTLSDRIVGFVCFSRTIYSICNSQLSCPVGQMKTCFRVIGSAATHCGLCLVAVADRHVHFSLVSSFSFFSAFWRSSFSNLGAVIPSQGWRTSFCAGNDSLAYDVAGPFCS